MLSILYTLWQAFPYLRGSMLFIIIITNCWANNIDNAIILSLIMLCLNFILFCYSDVPYFNPSQVLWNGWYLRVVIGRCLLDGGVAQAGAQQSRKYRLSRIFSAAFRRSRASRPAQRRGLVAVDTRTRTTARTTTTHQRIVRTVHLVTITLTIPWSLLKNYVHIFTINVGIGCFFQLQHLRLLFLDMFHKF